MGFIPIMFTWINMVFMCGWSWFYYGFTVLPCFYHGKLPPTAPSLSQFYYGQFFPPRSSHLSRTSANWGSECLRICNGQICNKWQPPSRKAPWQILESTWPFLSFFRLLYCYSLFSCSLDLLDVSCRRDHLEDVSNERLQWLQSRPIPMLNLPHHDWADDGDHDFPMIFPYFQPHLAIELSGHTLGNVVCIYVYIYISSLVYIFWAYDANIMLLFMILSLLYAILKSL